jgi:Phage phiEco32-like COOH.NH2 ligase-type 2
MKFNLFKRKDKGVGMNTIKDFIGRTNFVIKAHTPILKAGSNGVNGFNSYTWIAHEFPAACIFVISITKYTDSLSQVYYVNKSGINFYSVIVPNTFKVKELTAPLLLRVMDKITIQHLNRTVGRMPLTIGSDPEMFVEDENGKVIPAFQFLGGKDKPDRTAQGTYGNLPLYWDGFQAEFQTSPQGCLGWHTDSVQCGLKGLLIAARKVNPKAKVSSKTVMDVPIELLESGKEEHVQFGCMPSLNAYDMKGLQADGRQITFRPAGGHIHFGVNQYNGVKFTKDDYTKMVKTLDAILGVACVSLFANQDNPKRRELYGLAGEYRLPPHGLEYRVLSNAWLIHPMIMNMVIDLSRVTLTFGYKDMLKLWKATEEETIHCINKCDVELARKILKRNEELFLKLIKCAYGGFDEKYIKAIMKIFVKGMEYAIKDVNDIHTNWNLEGQWVQHTNPSNKNTGTSMAYVIKGKKVA